MNDANATFRRSLIGSAIFSAFLVSVSPSWANNAAAPSNFRLSGFMSITGGQVASGTLDDNYIGPTTINGVDCPCYIADWGNAGIYREKFSLKPESRVGVQANYKLNANVDFGAQLVSRGSDPTPNLQWAYAGYKPNNQLEIQVGRKRIPLYYYSDFQDIGTAYPWISAPPELYGWEATNYNGASVRYRSNVGNTNLTTTMFGGKETVKDSLYQKLFYTGKTKVTWDKLFGGDVEASNGPLTARLIYMQAQVKTTNIDNSLDNVANLHAYGIATNLDYDDWFLLTEFTQLTRKFVAENYKVTAPALTVGAGMRFGKWTPFLNYAQYIERTDDPNSYAPQSWRRKSVTLRYDIDANSAIKTQIDRQTDISNNFGGHVTMFRISFDRVF